MKIDEQAIKIKNNFFKFLDEQGITGYQIWKKTGISQGSISKIKNEQIQLSMGVFTKICSAFNIMININLEAKKNQIILSIIRSICYSRPIHFYNIGLELCFPKTRLMQITPIQV